MEKLRHLCIGIIIAVIILILVHFMVAILSFGNKRFLLPMHQEDSTLVENPIPSHFLSASVEDSLFTEYVKSLDHYYKSCYSEIIQSSDARIGRELNNLNLWITVWVLLIGGVTIALPIVSQYTGYNRVKNKITELKKQIVECSKRIEENAQKQAFTNVHHLSSLINVISNVSNEAFSEDEDRIKHLSRIMQDLEITLKNIYNHSIQDIEKIQNEHSFFVCMSLLGVSIEKIMIIMDRRELIALTISLKQNLDYFNKQYSHINNKYVIRHRDDFYNAFHFLNNSLHRLVINLVSIKEE
jgi:cell division protein FtsL